MCVLKAEHKSDIYRCIYMIIIITCCIFIGFAASNISETYDAKIFSVATLLSSYLMYNSMKVRWCITGT